uniref:uncharacterized protein LOC120325430 n=1 Tax=Styela clava TaxID=7725 RepID=UPI001939CA28|nr:uncharacterized protein LOC120325430 [Styela clava]
MPPNSDNSTFPNNILLFYYLLYPFVVLLYFQLSESSTFKLFILGYYYIFQSEIQNLKIFKTDFENVVAENQALRKTLSQCGVKKKNWWKVACLSAIAVVASVGCAAGVAALAGANLAATCSGSLLISKGSVVVSASAAAAEGSTLACVSAAAAGGSTLVCGSAVISTGSAVATGSSVICGGAAVTEGCVLLAGAAIGGVLCTIEDDSGGLQKPLLT